MTDEPVVCPAWEHETITQSLVCRGCGYDLRGLALDHGCPECGRAAWDSVLYAIDPHAEALPRIAHPGKVGNGLILLIAGLLCALFCLSIGIVAPGVEDLFLVKRPLQTTLVLEGAPWCAAFFLLVSMAGAGLLAPPRTSSSWGDERSTSVAGLLLSLGLVLAALALEALLGREGSSTSSPGTMPWRVPILCSAGFILFFFLRRVIRLIGERSRAFRTAGDERQRLASMMVATALLAVADVLRLFGEDTGMQKLEIIGHVLAAICLLLLHIGLIYLLINSRWIRKAILRPPPILRELLWQDDETLLTGLARDSRRSGMD